MWGNRHDRYTNGPVSIREMLRTTVKTPIWLSTGGTPTKEEIKDGKKFEMDNKVDSCRMELALAGDWE